MAITWKERGKDGWADGGVTHEGLVMSGSYTRTVRVMSDIYSDESYCKVYDPKTGESREVHLGGAFELNTKSGHAVVDLADEHKAAIEAKRAAAEAAWEAGAPEREAKAAAAAEKEAREAAVAAETEAREVAESVGDVGKGDEVVVYKGRKVPKGTVGVVIWVGESEWGGYRVGVKDADGEAHWTAMSNVKKLVMDKDDDESWVEYRDRKTADKLAAYETKMAAEAARPARWDEVVVLAEPEFVGKVFWERDGRYGVARLGARKVGGRSKPEDTRWVNADEIVQRDLYVAPEPVEDEDDYSAAFDDAELAECPF